VIPEVWQAKKGRYLLVTNSALDQSGSVATSPQGPVEKKGRQFLLIVFLLILVCSVLWGVGSLYHWLTFRPTGKIVFSCEAYSLCLVNADGTGYRLLTNGTEYSNPAWSPDGQQIALIRPGDDSQYILSVIQVDGSGVIALTSKLNEAGMPSWLPGGKQIVFSLSYPTHGEHDGIYVVNADGSNLSRLIDFGRGPVFSPDGALFTFKSGDAGDELYIADNQGMVKTHLTTDGRVYTLAWSPDEKKIAYIVNKYDLDKNIGRAALYFFEIGTATQTRVADAFVYYNSNLSWSPDGEKIAFNCAIPSGGGICSINSDQSGLVLLSDGWAPSWSPDGQYIAYQKSNPWCFPRTCNQIWIMRADGSQQTKITDGGNPAWQPAP
jgi:Tol biopolymer transport system component